MEEEETQSGYGSKILFLVLGAVANILLGFITLYASRLSADLKDVEAIARSGAANTALLGRDVENLTKWTVDEVRDLKERIKKIENDIRPYNQRK